VIDNWREQMWNAPCLSSMFLYHSDSMPNSAQTSGVKNKVQSGVAPRPPDPMDPRMEATIDLI
jgi:hypothetical protein